MSYFKHYVEAHITIDKDRQKIYDNNIVYLNDSSNFGIELFNGSTEVLTFKFKFNGESESRSLILYPSQRTWVDASLSDNRNNGLVEIEVYRESKFTIFNQPNYFWLSNSIGNCWSDSKLTNNSDLFNTYDMSDGSFKYNSQTTTSPFVINPTNQTTPNNKHNTGRVEKGEVSKENKYSTTKVSVNNEILVKKFTFQLKPMSDKPMSVNDINKQKKFCTECGRKVIKKGFKFCPECGSKI